MTTTGDRFGVVPNGRRGELPVFIPFAFEDDLISGDAEPIGGNLWKTYGKRCLHPPLPQVIKGDDT
ncbi:hypothetical protein ACH4SK_32240 [Streptomyces inhibens]|uniref:hypothetical protein n=1 Tax=Streptomyces inhibens TaxID=2293571 RepID=UPI003790A829